MINNINWKKNKFPGAKKILGLAIEETCIIMTDMYYDRGGFNVKSTARLDFPEGVSFENPKKLGDLLGTFIRENSFSTKKTVIGLPAKWLMIRGKEMPPSSGASVAGILKIHAEHEFSINHDELVIDYTGAVNSEKSSQIFLGAVLHKNYLNVLETTRSAGLSVLSVTVTSVALRTMICKQMHMTFPDYFIYLRPDGVEILAGDNEQVIDVKQLRRDKKSGVVSLMPALKRIISFNGKHVTSDEKASLMILDLSGSDGQEFRDIQNALSSRVDIVSCEPESLIGKLVLSSESDRKELIPPAAIVQGFSSRDSFYPDFYNSRMNEKAARIQKNHVMWASAIILCLVILIINTIYTWKSDTKDVAELKLKLSQISDDLKSAQDTVQKRNYARKWYSERPEVLRFLYELTMAFPVEGRIWATNLALNEDMKGIVSGKATDEKSVIEVLDSMKTSSLFHNVQMIYLRENGQSSQEVSFSMSFAYKGKG